MWHILNCGGWGWGDMIRMFYRNIFDAHHSKACIIETHLLLKELSCFFVLENKSFWSGITDINFITVIDHNKLIYLFKITSLTSFKSWSLEIIYENQPHQWCNDYHALLECDRLWVRVLVASGRSNQRL